MKKNQKSNYLAHTMLVPLDFKKILTQNLWTLWKRYRFTYWPKKSNFEKDWKENVISQTHMMGLQILVTLPRSGKWNWDFGMGFYQKMANVSSGQKKSKIMPNVGFELFLSLPFTFPVLVNENPCQIYTENNQISIFNFFHLNLVHYQYYKNVPNVDGELFWASRNQDLNWNRDNHCGDVNFPPKFWT